jgi:hypothetical protein
MAIVTLLGLAVYYFLPGLQAVRMGKKAITAASERSVLQAGPEKMAGQNPVLETDADKKVAYESAPWGRNPFLTEEETKQKEPVREDLQVKAIITGKPRSVATVDGHTVVVGEKIGDEIVSEILPNAVVLEKEGQKRVLRVSEPFISIEVKEMKNEAQ